MRFCRSWQNKKPQNYQVLSRVLNFQRILFEPFVQQGGRNDFFHGVGNGNHPGSLAIDTHIDRGCPGRRHTLGSREHCASVTPTFRQERAAANQHIAPAALPFDPLAAEEPDVTRPLADRDQGGLGILLVRRVMDEVHYRREGGRNCLRIAVKKG